MRAYETVQRSLDFDPIRDESFKIVVNTPYNFTLYNTLALLGEIIPLPYLYSEESWRCMIRTCSGKYVPACVCPWNDEGILYLTVRLFYDYTTKEERELKKTIVKIFCSELDLSPFYQKASEDILFFRVVEKLFGLKPYFSQDPFEALIKAVIRQLVRAEIARRSISLLVLRFGNKQIVEGNNYYGFPSPEVLSRASKDQLVECNIGYKWKLIKKLSCDVVSGDLDLFDLEKLGDEEVIERLIEYKGIGYWTSRIFLYDGLKRLDSYPIHDISLKKALSRIYFQGKTISWTEVEKFFDHYKDFVGIAVNYLFGALWLERARAGNKR